VLPAAIFATVLLGLATSYGINIWNRANFDAPEQRDADTVVFWSIVYFPLLAVSVCLVISQVYARMTMQRRWRAWLNNHLLDRWIGHGRYYQLNLIGGDHKNPEYRIADDVRVATELCDWHNIAVLSAVTFIVVLWNIGGAFSFNLGAVTISIPGFLVVAAVIYAVLASGAMAFIGRRFVTVSESKNEAEAQYRYVLTRLREHGESIAVLGGEAEERSAVGRSAPHCCDDGARSVARSSEPRSSLKPAAISHRSCPSSCARLNSLMDR
jgi:putative ATP-binding cassette transporter